MPFDPARQIQDYLVFGEFGDVNPSVCDSSTFTFLNAATMAEAFQHDIEGCFLYARHWNPTNKYLSAALARMEDGAAAQVTASGMAAISATLLQLCSAGDRIISGRTVYGGTYALMKNVLPRFGIITEFVDLQDEVALTEALTPRTRVLYCESINNPLLEVADIGRLAAFARAHGMTMVVDNTFSPLIVSPLLLGADVVIHSMTKFINGMSDCVAGCVIGSEDLIHRMNDVTSGTTMLLGPVLDSTRAAGVLKNLHTLPVRMARHSANAEYLARHFQDVGLDVHYPGLPTHPQHELLTAQMNAGFGYGGVVSVDVGDHATAERLMMRMQQEHVGYLAVSLGYFKTLFSAPGHSTSSEIPDRDREQIGLSDGLIRFSVGLDNDIARTWRTIEGCLDAAGVLAAVR